MLVKLLNVVKANKTEIAIFTGAVNQAVFVKQPMALRIATVALSAGSIYCSKVEKPNEVVVASVIGLAAVHTAGSIVSQYKNKQFLKSTGIGLLNVGLILATKAK